MRIATKVAVFFIIGFFLISFSLGLISIFGLLNNQNDNLEISKNELLETGREFVWKNSALFFDLLDKRIRENSSVSVKDILRFIREADPEYKRQTVVMDTRNKSLFKGYDRTEISALLDRSTVERYLDAMVLTRNRDFYLDNYNKFHADKKDLVIPVAAQFRIYDSYGLIIGRGRVMETASVRINFIKKKIGEYFRLYLVFSLFLYSLMTVVAVVISMRFMKRFFIVPLKQIGSAVNRVAKGELDVRIATKAKDEIGLLAASFNRMTGELQKTTTSIANLNKEIAERKTVEEQLRKSEGRFQDIAINTGDWIWEIDNEGRYIYSSPAVEKILGYKPAEILGKYFYDFFNPQERDGLKKAAFEVFSQKKLFQYFLNRNIHKDGHTVILETSGVPVVDADARLIGYRGVDRDITERKKAEEEQKRLMKDLEETNRIMTGRELKMIELKKEINKLNEELGRPAPYDAASLE